MTKKLFFWGRNSAQSSSSTAACDSPAAAPSHPDSVARSPASPFDVFLAPDAQNINRARLEHLASLGLDLDGKDVLEVGAGIGLHTHFFEERGCSVASTDGAPANVAEMMRRWPNRRVGILDLEIPADLRGLGSFDVIFCYGTLYHLRDPDAALARLAAICRGVILLETVVSRGAYPEINPVLEPSAANQAVSGIGCRPTRSWVMAALRRHFGHAYTTLDQPDYPDFVTDWNLIGHYGNLRAVFVAARHPLNVPALVAALPVRHRNAVPRLGEPAATRVWIDVGAHRGEHSMPVARQQPDLVVHAFEPLPSRFEDLCKGPQNYHVHAMAVGEQNGVAPFYVNRFDAASSLLALDEDARAHWKGGSLLGEQREILVPVTRLDSFMQRESIGHVEFLKIDAQGADLSVLRSAADRLADIDKVQLEVAVTPAQLYRGAADKPTVLEFMAAHGFRLTETERQSDGQEENLTFVRVRAHEAPGTRATVPSTGAELPITGLFDLDTALTVHGEASYKDGVLELITNERQWHYTAVVPIGVAFKDASDDRFRIEMAVQVDVGTLQAGILDREEKDFPSSALIHAGPEWQHITLMTPPLDQAGPLVLRNASEMGASHGRCRLVSIIRVASAAMAMDEPEPVASEAEMLAAQLGELSTILAEVVSGEVVASVAASVVDAVSRLRPVLARGGHALVATRADALASVFAGLPTSLLCEVAAAIAVPPRPGPTKWRMDGFVESSELASFVRFAVWLALLDRDDVGSIVVPWFAGTRLALTFRNDVGRSIFVGAQYEPNEFALLDRILRSGMTFLDGGANEGAYTVFAAARVGPQGRVVAVEPSPREMLRLHDNVALNRFANVKTIEAALGERSGECDLLLAETRHAGQNTLGNFMYQGVSGAGRIRVAATTIDNLMNQGHLNALDVIKLDLEGAELRALQGARQVLEQCQPLIMLEGADAALAFQGGSRTALLALLSDHGYSVRTLEPETGELIAMDTAASAETLVAVHPDRAQYFGI